MVSGIIVVVPPGSQGKLIPAEEVTGDMTNGPRSTEADVSGTSIVMLSPIRVGGMIVVALKMIWLFAPTLSNDVSRATNSPSVYLRLRSGMLYSTSHVGAFGSRVHPPTDVTIANRKIDFQQADVNRSSPVVVKN